MMHWRRRIHDHRLFRKHLSIPLVTVEFGYDGHFDFQHCRVSSRVEIHRVTAAGRVRPGMGFSP